MWTRVELKTKAKDVLRKIYWQAFFVSLVIALAEGGRNNNFNINLGNRQVNPSNFLNRFLPSNATEQLVNYRFLGLTLVSISILGLFFLLFKLFLGYNLQVGGRRYFIKAANQEIAVMEELGFGFSRGRYFNIMKTMLVRGILVFLWSLLLVIPGIVKSYAYRMVPYILADNPNIDYKRAIELSNQMTMGHKEKIFVLDLSFIGWFLLGSLLIGLGIFFVFPYVNATNAELYLVLKQNALETGICTPEELYL